MRTGYLTLPLVVGLAVLGGCRLTGKVGPISRSLATSRQLSQRGVAAMEHGRWQQAEEYLAEAVKACSADPEARRYYAEVLWHRDLRQEAVAQLQKAGEADPANASIEARLAEWHLAMKQQQLARQHAERAVELDPRSAAAWAVRAQVAESETRLDDSLADYHRALALNPKDQRIQLAIAELHRELNQPERALAALQALADSYSPGEEPQQVLYLEGLAYMALGRHEDAAEYLAAACHREPPTADMLGRLAEARLRSGDPAGATAAAREALALDPEHRLSWELLNHATVAMQGKPPLE